MIDTRLLILTDRSQLPDGRTLLDTLAACAQAGATHVVVRERDLPAHDRTDLFSALATLPLTLISSRLPEPSAAMIHLSADQEAPAGLTFGRSCHSAEDVERAAAEGCSYVTLSPFADSISKPGYGPPIAREAYAGHRIPVFALGGVTVATTPAALAAGAQGVAVMGEIMRADDPAAVVKQFLEVLA